MKKFIFLIHRTALDIAARNNNIEIVKLLLMQKGIIINVNNEILYSY